MLNFKKELGSKFDADATPLTGMELLKSPFCTMLPINQECLDLKADLGLGSQNLQSFNKQTNDLLDKLQTEGTINLNQAEYEQLLLRAKTDIANRTRNFLPSPTTGRDRPREPQKTADKPMGVNRIFSKFTDATGLPATWVVGGVIALLFLGGNR